MKIAIVKFSALGDLIWTLPLIHRLCSYFPNGEVTLITDPMFRGLLTHQKSFKKLFVKKPQSISDYFSTIGSLKSIDEVYDVLICAQSSLRVNVLYPFIKSKRKIGFDDVRGKDGQKYFINESIPFQKEHNLDALLGFADYLTGETSSHFEYGSFYTDKEIQLVSELVGAQQFIAFHPKASLGERTWSIENISKFINEVTIKFPVKIVLTGAPGDSEFCEEISKRTQALNLAGKSNLNQLAALFSKAKLVVAPDSGPIHLANAVGTTTMGLYAAVPPSFTGPYGQFENCVNAYPLALEQFCNLQEVDAPWMKRVRHKNLMDVITPKMAFDKFLTLYNENL